MTTGTQNISARLIQLPNFLPQTFDFVESLAAGGGRLNGKQTGEGASHKIDVSFSKSFAHPNQIIRPLKLFGLPVKDVPP